MNGRSLKLIRDVIINSGKMTSVEISHDSIYLQFSDVELGTPKLDSEFNLTARFGEDSFLTAFYNNIWDIDFLSKYNFKYEFLREDIRLKVKNIRFNDFEYLNRLFEKYQKDKSISTVEDFNIRNIRNDFFMIVEAEDIAIVLGGNQMDFFTPSERLDDATLRELSNEWMLYFLKYQKKRNLIRDPMCENHPLRY